MSELNSDDRAQRAQALLGLRLNSAESVAVGEEPTAEDFAALYEGELEPTRRAQILSHIVSSPEIYERWIEAVSAMSAMDASPSVEAYGESPPETLVSRAVNWFIDGFRKPALVGSMSAAALVAILVIPGGEESLDQAGDEQSVAALYSQFGGNWQVSPSTLPDRAIRSTGDAKDFSVQQQAVSLGLNDGVAALGEGFPKAWLPHVDSSLTAEQVLAGSEAAYFELGKLAAIARFKCQLEGEDAFFLEAEALLDGLAPALDSAESDYSRRLSRVIEQPGTAEERVCDFSSAAVALLSQK